MNAVMKNATVPQSQDFPWYITHTSDHHRRHLCEVAGCKGQLSRTSLSHLLHHCLLGSHKAPNLESWFRSTNIVNWKFHGDGRKKLGIREGTHKRRMPARNASKEET